MEVPRNIEGAIALTSDEVMNRGMIELRAAFMDPQFTDEDLKNALQVCDLNVASAVDYLRNMCISMSFMVVYRTQKDWKDL